MKTIIEVHIVPVWNETERALAPIKRHRPDIVYLLENKSTSPSGDRDELKGAIHDAGGSVHTVAVDLFDMYDVMGSVTTLADDHGEDATVRVNVSSGPKHAAIGATMACMDEETDAFPYSVNEKAPTPESEPATDGPYSEAEPLDIYPIDSPTRDQLAGLAIVKACNTNGRKTKLGTIIDEGLKLDLGCLNAASSDKAQYGKLSTHIVDPLEDKAYIETTEAGRNKHVRVTDTGLQTLRAFRHRIEDVIETLENSHTQNVDLELEDPTDSIEQWRPST